MPRELIAPRGSPARSFVRSFPPKLVARESSAKKSVSVAIRGESATRPSVGGAVGRRLLPRLLFCHSRAQIFRFSSIFCFTSSYISIYLSIYHPFPAPARNRRPIARRRPPATRSRVYEFNYRSVSSRTSDRLFSSHVSRFRGFRFYLFFRLSFFLSFFLFLPRTGKNQPFV